MILRLNRTDRQIVDSRSRLLAAVGASANTTGSATDSCPVSHQAGAEGYTTMFEWRLRKKTDNMPSPEKDRLAAEAMHLLGRFPGRSFFGQAEISQLFTQDKKSGRRIREHRLILRSLTECWQRTGSLPADSGRHPTPNCRVASLH